MQLATQDLFGFKSFAKRTRFDFGSGVTVIVGPNGCGKSNVVDSLKWVLGEQSAKSLRGSEMMDVIFNGSKNRKPLGFAEATLTFRGCRGVIHSELDQISVTRKLHRSGESEYQINKKPCRLKDIRELFMDTGVGMRAYSIIEQGKIDALLQASGAERRAIFDEAAGISKYKARKKEAERRLQRTEQNLVIIETTLEEVSKRLRSLKIQAGRARSFKHYSEALRKLRIAQALHKYHGFRRDQVDISGNLVLAQGERDKLVTALSSKEADLSNLEERLHQCEEALRRAVSESDRLDQQITSSEERKGGLRSHHEDLAKEEVRFQARLQDCLDQIERGRKDREEAGERLEEERGRESALQAEIDEAREKIDQVLGRIEAIAGKQEDRKAEGFENEAVQSSERSRAGRIEVELARLGKQSAGVEARHRELTTQHGAAMTEVKRLEEEIAELETTATGLSEALRAAQREVEDLREHTKRLQSEEEYRDRLEGVGEGAAQVVREASREGEALPGIHGLLADRFQVDPRHVKAIEAALGHLTDAVVAKDLDGAMDAVTFLREAGRGRGCFVPLPEETIPAAAPEETAYPGVVGRASDLVNCAEEDRALVRKVLGGTLVVESLETALGLRNLVSPGVSFAALSGETLDAEGVLTGGMAVKGRMAHATDLMELEE
ncbi:MAG: chromosome segregation SMC family protein, partial [Planctomycetota bacterium]